MKGEMGKMSIDFNMIKSEVENLARELNRHRDNDLSHNDMIAVSDLLAETVYMIRKKYRITTLYYMVSEEKAIQGIGSADLLSWKEGVWIENTPGWYMCSECKNVQTTDRSRFCPNCGRRMKV